MISGLEISGFKRFEDQHFPLSPLTVLAGMNGSGKTSAIQALLLLAEAARNRTSSSLKLNGPYGLQLGTADEVRNWRSAGDVTLSLHSPQGEHKWVFSVPDDESLFFSIKKRPLESPVGFTADPRTFNYLSAERLGPRSVQFADSVPVERLEVGHEGQFVARLIHALGDRPIVHESRKFPFETGGSAPLLKYEIEHWLDQIVRAVEIDTEVLAGTPVTALKYRARGGEWVRAPNMGFGVSYALPIIVAGLLAAPGGLLIVENPEAHLHPAGQSHVGSFLAFIASKGVQVLVETHSDHVLNGIRRAIGEHQFIHAEQANVLFFDDAVEGAAEVKNLLFTPMGGIRDWPPGFFDQYQIDATALGRVRRQS